MNTSPANAPKPRGRPRIPSETRHWYQALRRRSQRTQINWTRMDRLAKRWLPPAATAGARTTSHHHGRASRPQPHSQREPVERRMLGDGHVRCGGRAGETGRERSRNRPPVRPLHPLPPGPLRGDRDPGRGLPQVADHRVGRGELHPGRGRLHCRARSYGHPSMRTIGLLERDGAAVFRTDTDGAIAVLGAQSGLLSVVPRGKRQVSVNAAGPPAWARDRVRASTSAMWQRTRAPPALSTSRRQSCARACSTRRLETRRLRAALWPRGENEP